MSERNRFVFFESYLTSAELLPTEVEQLEYLKDICQYGIYGKVPESFESPYVCALFTAIKPTLEISIKRAEAGAKGGAKSRSPHGSPNDGSHLNTDLSNNLGLEIGNKDKGDRIKDKDIGYRIKDKDIGYRIKDKGYRIGANPSKAEANESKAEANESKAEANESKAEANESKIEQQQKGTQNQISDGTLIATQERAFDEFWALYPKKRSKGQAKKVWDKLNPSKETIDAIMGKIPELMQTQDWTKDGGQFIPYPATWLNASGWEDEVTPEQQEESSNIFLQLMEEGAFDDE